MKRVLSIISLATLAVLQARVARADDQTTPATAPTEQPATSPAAQPVTAPMAVVPAPTPPTEQRAATPAEQPAPANHDNWREPGRFGAIGAVTDDGFQFGVIRADEHFEAVLTVDSSFAALGSSTGLSGATGDLGMTLRTGPRFSLGHLNYLSLGGLGYVALFGKDNGVSTWGMFRAGPYASLQRNFAGTPLMISLWVMPYQFARTVTNDGTGKAVTVDEHQFFQGGGFGLAYLF